MNRSHASAAVLGTSAALAAAFLARPAPTLAATRNARANITIAAARRTAVGVAMRSLLRADPSANVHITTPHATTAAPRTVAIAVCRACAPSRALVRVLLRRQRHGTTVPPLRFFADQTWPALDTLARHSRSTVVITSRLAARVGITPAAISSTHPAPAIGVHEVLALTATQAMIPRRALP